MWGDTPGPVSASLIPTPLISANHGYASTRFDTKATRPEQPSMQRKFRFMILKDDNC